MKNLEVNFLGTNFNNPLILASGVLGVTSGSWKRVVELGAGGITTKSVFSKPHQGHPNPVMFGTENYFLNAVGLSDAGIKKAQAEVAEFYKQKPSPLIFSIAGGTENDFVEVAEKVNEISPDFVEVNISCPNVESEFGKPFAADSVSASKICKIVKTKTKTPIIVKLSPNVENIAKIAKSVENAGADAICAINTVGPGMRFNLDLQAPILANRVGGLSGPAIFPIAVRAVFEIYRSVKIPIIATGGINSGKDALEIMAAGGTLCGIGTAIYFHGDDFWKQAKQEMSDWLEKNNIKNVSKIIGMFHKN